MLGSPCKANEGECLLTKLSCVVPTVIKEKLVLRWDVPRGAKVNFSIVRISHQILFFPVPTAIWRVMKKSAPGILKKKEKRKFLYISNEGTSVLASTLKKSVTSVICR